MAKSMHGMGGIGQEAVGRRPQHPEVPSERKAEPGLMAPSPTGTGGIVPRPTGEQGGPGHAPARRKIGLKATCRFGALDQARHHLARQAGGGERRIRPVPSVHIEPKRAGRIRHFLDGLAGQGQAHISLGQQHESVSQRRLLAHAGASPQPIWAPVKPTASPCCPSPHADRAIWRFQFRTFGLRAAAVIPQDRRPERLMIGPEQHGTLHLLTRQTDALDPRRPRLGWVVFTGASTADITASTQAWGACSEKPG